jgi:hypothetical protein
VREWDGFSGPFLQNPAGVQALAEETDCCGQRSIQYTCDM